MHKLELLHRLYAYMEWAGANVWTAVPAEVVRRRAVAIGRLAPVSLRQSVWRRLHTSANFKLRPGRGGAPTPVGLWPFKLRDPGVGRCV